MARGENIRASVRIGSPTATDQVRFTPDGMAVSFGSGGYIHVAQGADGVFLGGLYSSNPLGATNLMMRS